MPKQTEKIMECLNAITAEPRVPLAILIWMRICIHRPGVAPFYMADLIVARTPTQQR